MLAPMPVSDPSDSLLSALTKARITSENHQFIRRLTDRVGISSYAVVDSDKPYVRAIRIDGHRDLHINWGYTGGFISREDALRACGGAGDVAPSGSIKGTWYVTHPVNRVHTRSGHTRKVQREAGFCATCSQQLPLTGVCGNCD
jgi:hypothetical protein